MALEVCAPARRLPIPTVVYYVRNPAPPPGCRRLGWQVFPAAKGRCTGSAVNRWEPYTVLQTVRPAARLHCYIGYRQSGQAGGQGTDGRGFPTAGRSGRYHCRLCGGIPAMSAPNPPMCRADVRSVQTERCRSAIHGAMQTLQLTVAHSCGAAESALSGAPLASGLQEPADPAASKRVCSSAGWPPAGGAPHR